MTTGEPRQRCLRPPPGWRCTRALGHDGPYAAHQVRALERSRRWFNSRKCRAGGHVWYVPDDGPLPAKCPDCAMEAAIEAQAKVPHIGCATYTGFEATFGLFKEQDEALRTWMGQHDEEHVDPKRGHLYGGAIRGGYTYEFTPTSIGVVVRCRCSCGESVDVSAYDTW